jgi:hypothetical protein
MRVLLIVSSLAAAAACSSAATPPGASSKALTKSPSGDLHDTVRRLTARQPGGAVATPGPGGYQVFKVQEGGAQVVVGRTNPDGTVTAKCVDSPDDTFLDDARGSQR